MSREVFGKLLGSQSFHAGFPDLFGHPITDMSPLVPINHLLANLGTCWTARFAQTEDFNNVSYFGCSRGHDCQLLVQRTSRRTTTTTSNIGDSFPLEEVGRLSRSLLLCTFATTVHCRCSPLVCCFICAFPSFYQDACN